MLILLLRLTIQYPLLVRFPISSLCSKSFRFWCFPIMMRCPPLALLLINLLTMGPDIIVNPLKKVFFINLKTELKNQSILGLTPAPPLLVSKFQGLPCSTPWTSRLEMIWEM